MQGKFIINGIEVPNTITYNGIKRIMYALKTQTAKSMYLSSISVGDDNGDSLASDNTGSVRVHRNITNLLSASRYATRYPITSRTDSSTYPFNLEAKAIIPFTSGIRSIKEIGVWIKNYDGNEVLFARATSNGINVLPSVNTPISYVFSLI